jgi:hydroxymethylpyrimidine/phosphomethylpyrimidine kinase
MGKTLKDVVAANRMATEHERHARKETQGPSKKLSEAVGASMAAENDLKRAVKTYSSEAARQASRVNNRSSTAVAYGSGYDMSHHGEGQPLKEPK